MHDKVGFPVIGTVFQWPTDGRMIVFFVWWLYKIFWQVGYRSEGSYSCILNDSSCKHVFQQRGPHLFSKEKYISAEKNIHVTTAKNIYKPVWAKLTIWIQTYWSPDSIGLALGSWNILTWKGQKFCHHSTLHGQLECSLAYTFTWIAVMVEAFTHGDVHPVTIINSEFYSKFIQCEADFHHII